MHLWYTIQLLYKLYSTYIICDNNINILLYIDAFALGFQSYLAGISLPRKGVFSFANHQLSAHQVVMSSVEFSHLIGVTAATALLTVASSKSLTGNHSPTSLLPLIVDIVSRRKDK